MTRLFAAALCLALATPAFAKNEQQDRMKECNEKAAGKKGDDRKAFMSSCLKGEEAAPAKMTPQERMKDCNKKAEGKKGDDRKKFMSECLKG
jgi:psiF repeat